MIKTQLWFYLVLNNGQVLSDFLDFESENKEEAQEFMSLARENFFEAHRDNELFVIDPMDDASTDTPTFTLCFRDVVYSQIWFEEGYAAMDV